jgi:PIN domain nuclease of toxin-antitoxin system
MQTTSTHFLDTQVLVWLAEGQVAKLSPAATAAIEAEDVAISPMVLLELEYLYEIKRIVVQPLALVNQLQIQIGLAVSDASFNAVMHTALFETWTRDPFDRVIVAHARTANSPLVTSDSKIRENYPRAIW